MSETASKESVPCLPQQVAGKLRSLGYAVVHSAQGVQAARDGCLVLLDLDDTAHPVARIKLPDDVPITVGMEIEGDVANAAWHLLEEVEVYTSTWRRDRPRRGRTALHSVFGHVRIERQISRNSWQVKAISTGAYAEVEGRHLHVLYDDALDGDK